MQTLTRSIGVHSFHTHLNSNQGRISNADHVSSTASSLVRGSLTILFSQYTLVIISGLETTVIALKKAMVQRLLHFDRPFPAGHQIHRCTRGRISGQDQNAAYSNVRRRVYWQSWCRTHESKQSSVKPHTWFNIHWKESVISNLCI